MFSNLFSRPNSKRIVSPLARPPHRSAHRAGIECLEERIAPASLSGANTILFQDQDGDMVSVVASKNIFTKNKVNKIFKFDTGKVNGSTDVAQSLELINLSLLKGKAADVSLTVSVVTQGATGDGFVNVGFINGGHIDLGSIVVNGDLGRIVAGDSNTSTPGIDLLHVHSMGVMGLTNQPGSSSLASGIAGELTSLIIDGDLVNATIGVGNPAHAVDGRIGEIFIGGSMLGGVGEFSGAIRATGDIGPVHVVGDVIGGGAIGQGLAATAGGAFSATIGTSGSIGTVQIDGSIRGGSAEHSGAILSATGTGIVTIGGDIFGGDGLESGTVGTTGTLAGITVSGSIYGGAGEKSGAILSALDIGAVQLDGSLVGGGAEHSGAILSGTGTGLITIGGDMIGGDGVESGTVGTAGTLAGITVSGSVYGGAGERSGDILSSLDMGPIKIVGSFNGGSGIDSGQIGSTGNIASFEATSLSGGAGLRSGSVFAAGNIGPVTLGDMTFGAGELSGSLNALGSIGQVTVANDITGNAPLGAGSIFAGDALVGVTAKNIIGAEIYSATRIGDITVDGFMADVAILSLGDIGAISQYGEDSVGQTAGIYHTVVKAVGSIGDIHASDPDIASNGSDAIIASAFNAGQNIGAFTVNGGIVGSVIVAGTFLDSSFGTNFNHVGDFDNAAAVSFGFGIGAVASSSGGRIGGITLNGAKPTAPPLLIDTTIVAGIIGAGNDDTFGTADDVAISDSGIGDIAAYGGMDHVFVAGGSIGETIAQTGGIASVTYLAVDSGGSGIGGITLDVGPLFGVGQLPLYNLVPLGISHSKFISATNIGDIAASGIDHQDGTPTDAPFVSSIFMASGDIGIISALTIGSGEGFAISQSAFNAGGNIAGIFGGGQIDQSLFVAGIQFGSDFGEDLQGVGSPDFGYGHATVLAYSSSAASIGEIEGFQATLDVPSISQSTFIAGVNHGGANGLFGQGGDSVNAGSSIGDIHTTSSLDNVFIDSGSVGVIDVGSGTIINTRIVANDSNANGIGNISVTQLRSGTAIDSSTFISNSAIGDINAATLRGGVAIESSHFRSTLGIGTIVTSSVNNITQGGPLLSIHSTYFTTGGDIGDIQVIGEVSDSHFLAGVDLGADFAFGGTGLKADTYNGGTSVGNVFVTGRFLGSDIVASVIPSSLAKTTYGNETTAFDQNVGVGGTIGSVQLDTDAVSPLIYVQSWNNSGETNAIEAKSIYFVTIGSLNSPISINVIQGGSEVHWGAGGNFVPDVDLAIRQI